jgi:hypothetical protein
MKKARLERAREGDSSGLLVAPAAIFVSAQ